MKSNRHFFKALAIAGLSILFVQCADDTDPDQRIAIPLFSESNISLIHNDSESAWYITEVINEYYDANYELEIELGCVTDDIYTFSASQEEVQITLGDALCFADIDDGIFTADHEIFESRLLYMNGAGSAGPTIYLGYARGYTNADHTASGATSTFYRLAELTEDRMVFHRGGGEYIGEYKQALVFERIE